MSIGNTQDRWSGPRTTILPRWLSGLPVVLSPKVPLTILRMIAVVQRVLNAKVTVAGQVMGEISRGLAVLASVHADDTDDDLTWTAEKLVAMRVFPDADNTKSYELDVRDAGCSILLISNFTVAAETAKGRRPSLSAAAAPEAARGKFATFVNAVRALLASDRVATGEFGASMLVEIVNEGPCTFLLDSRQRPNRSTLKTLP